MSKSPKLSIALFKLFLILGTLSVSSVGFGSSVSAQPGTTSFRPGLPVSGHLHYISSSYSDLSTLRFTASGSTSGTAMPATLHSGTLATTSGTASPNALVTGLHVEHPSGYTPYLANSQGNFVLLRGIANNALVQYPSDYGEAPPVSSSDLAEMAALGFNFLRLPVSWSEIMLSPGAIDQQYLDKVAQVVQWAAKYGIGVLVDMHQDNYSAALCTRRECDGAPSWAVVDNGVSCAPNPIDTPCVHNAFRNFWANIEVHGKPLQQWYLQAAIAVAKAAGAATRFSNIVGIELMNEPNPTGPGVFEQQSLYPFYRKMINGLRSAGIVVPLWFEPSAIRNFLNNALPQAEKFSSDPNLVYAVHMYTGVFSPPFSSSVPFSDLQSSYSYAKQEAAVFGTPLVADEFGSNPTSAWNRWLYNQIALQNTYRVGSAFWLWKQRTGYWYNWSLVNLDGSLHHSNIRAQVLGMPHIDGVPGRLVSTTASAGNLSATVDGPGGVATIWGGVVVRSGGATLQPHTVRYVSINGHPTQVNCQPISYQTSNVSLGGCLLSVHIPAGCQLIVAGISSSSASSVSAKPSCPPPAKPATVTAPSPSPSPSALTNTTSSAGNTSSAYTGNLTVPAASTGKPWNGQLWWWMDGLAAMLGFCLLLLAFITGARRRPLAAHGRQRCMTKR